METQDKMNILFGKKEYWNEINGQDTTIYIKGDNRGCSNITEAQVMKKIQIEKQLYIKEDWVCSKPYEG